MVSFKLRFIDIVNSCGFVIKEKGKEKEKEWEVQVHQKKFCCYPQFGFLIIR